MTSLPTDRAEKDPGDHPAGQTAGTEAPAGRRRVTAPLQVTGAGARLHRAPVNECSPSQTNRELPRQKGRGQGGDVQGETSSTGIKTKELHQGGKRVRAKGRGYRVHCQPRESRLSGEKSYGCDITVKDQKKKKNLLGGNGREIGPCGSHR